MITESFMLHSLNILLKNGEVLLHPIFGVLVQGSKQYPAFFGFTEDYLLIALVRGKHITYTSRVPLNINMVKVKKNLFNRETIDIGFVDGPPCRIIVSHKVINLGDQSDNINGFLKYLRSKSSKKSISELDHIVGDKIRWQYFNWFIYIILSFVPFTMEMVFLLGIKNTPFILTETMKIAIFMLGAFCAVCSPFVIGSIFNRSFFGKIICVFNDQGIFFESFFLKWNEVEKIVYHPQLPSKSGIEYNYATIYVTPEGQRKYNHDVFHFPVYGMKKAKKYNPGIKTSFDKSDVFPIILVELISIVIPIIGYFII